MSEAKARRSSRESSPQPRVAGRRKAKPHAFRHPGSLSLSEILHRLEDGRDEGIPKRIELDLESLRREDVIALIEIIRHKSSGTGYGVQYSQSSGLKSLLGVDLPEVHLVCSLIDAGDFGAARQRVEERGSDDPEMIMQGARARVFLGEFDRAHEELQRMLRRSDVLLSTRGVGHQLLGHCLMERGDFRSSLDSLKIAIQLAESIGNRQGKLAANLFLVKVNCLTGDLKVAEERFEESKRFISQGDESFRWLIGLYRTWMFLLFSKGEPDFLRKALVAILLAGALGDQVSSVRTLMEVLLMSRTLGLISQPDYARLVSGIGADEAKEGDLPLWRASLANPENSSSWPQTLKHLHLRATLGRPTSESHELISRFIELRSGALKPAWVLDHSFSSIYDLEEKGHRIFVDDSPILKLVETLANLKAPMESGSAFERAWGIRWNDAIHPNTLGVAISRLNANNPSFQVRRKGGTLLIPRSGLVAG